MPPITLCLLVSSVDNLCKPFGPRLGLIWIQTVWHSNDIPERIFRNSWLKKLKKNQQMTKKQEKFPGFLNFVTVFKIHRNVSKIATHLYLATGLDKKMFERKLSIFSYPSVLTKFWVLKRTISLRWFFWVPTTYVLVEKEEKYFL